MITTFAAFVITFTVSSNFAYKYVYDYGNYVYGFRNYVYRYGDYVYNL